MNLRTYFFLFLIFFVQLVANAAALECPQPYKNKNARGSLTYLWHLEVIGADLAKDFNKGKQLATFGVAIVDVSLPSKCNCPHSVISSPTYIDNITAAEKIHGQLVSSILNGPNGATDIDEFYHQIVDDYFRKDGGSYAAELEKAKKSSKGLKVVNYSVKASLDLATNRIKDFKKLDEQGVITVIPSGNDGKRISDPSQFENLFPGIVVEGFNYKGQRWRNSNTTPRSLVIAPADDLATLNGDGDPNLKSGTSLAGPLVSGSIVNALGFLPDMNRPIVEELIKATSIKMDKVKSKFAGQSAPGMLNSYKMVRVADRIRIELSKTKIKDPNEIRAFISAELKKPQTVNFSVEAKQLANAASKVIVSDRCSDLSTAEKALRSSYLLEPTPETKGLLVKVYEKMGFKLNADFYR
ncbi:MAG: hypothetical protein B7Y39_10430 [Bdellovibrio sp. 28-41-41]|nr:MAG: hypothetical protein B7Y39_10430 [Bdellovibrio sp. 28-41-41]